MEVSKIIVGTTKLWKLFVGLTTWEEGEITSALECTLSKHKTHTQIFLAILKIAHTHKIFWQPWKLEWREKKQSTQLKHKAQSKLSKLHKTNLFSCTHPSHGLRQSSISTNDIECHHFLALMQQHNDVQHSFPNHSREKGLHAHAI